MMFKDLVFLGMVFFFMVFIATILDFVRFKQHGVTGYYPSESIAAAVGTIACALLYLR